MSFTKPCTYLFHPAHFSLHLALCNILNLIRTKILHIIGQIHFWADLGPGSGIAYAGVDLFHLKSVTGEEQRTFLSVDKVQVKLVMEAKY